MAYAYAAARPAPAIRRAATDVTDAARAAETIDHALGAQACSLILLCCSGDYALAAISEQLAVRRPEARVVGALGSAVMGPNGYRSHGVCATGFPGEAEIVTTSLEGIRGMDFACGFQAATWLKSEMHRTTGQAPDAEDTFALLLVDGLTLCEERLVASIAQGLGNLHLVGGSTGDHFRGLPGRTWHAGREHSNAAVLALVRPQRPFQAFTTHHFTPGEQRLLVTRADPEHRVILELNGQPAAYEYARAIAQPPETLSLAVRAARPLIVKVGDSYYVRSVRLVSTDPQEGLAFACAVERGIVLRVAHAGDLVADLSDRLDAVAADLGGISATLAFDCALRLGEIEASGRRATTESLLERFGVCGIASYGEQFEHMHLNQTFTGIAFGHA